MHVLVIVSGPPDVRNSVKFARSQQEWFKFPGEASDPVSEMRGRVFRPFQAIWAAFGTRGVFPSGMAVVCLIAAHAAFGGIPGDVDGLNSISGALLPPQFCGPWIEPPEPSGTLAGARRIFVETYQSCGVLDVAPIRIPPMEVVQGVETRDVDANGTYTFRRLKDRDAFLRTNPYLAGTVGVVATEGSTATGCMDPRAMPPIYGYGSRPSFEGASELSIHEDRSQSGLCLPESKVAGASGVGRNGIFCGGSSVQALDCAGFIDSAFAIEGLAIRPGEPIRPALDGTYAFRAAADDSKSCLGTVAAKVGDPPFSSGDLFVTGGGHMVIFDFVGPDPLGIEKVENCDELSPAVFNFTVLQSSPFGGEIGVQRTEGSSFYSDTRKHMTEFLALARAYCHQQKDKVPVRFEWKSVKGAIVRHKGTAVAGCVDPTMKRDAVPVCAAVQGCDLRRDGITPMGGAG